VLHSFRTIGSNGILCGIRAGFQLKRNWGLGSNDIIRNSACRRAGAECCERKAFCQQVALDYCKNLKAVPPPPPPPLMSGCGAWSKCLAFLRPLQARGLDQARD